MDRERYAGMRLTVKRDRRTTIPRRTAGCNAINARRGLIAGGAEGHRDPSRPVRVRPLAAASRFAPALAPPATAEISRLSIILIQ